MNCLIKLVICCLAFTTFTGYGHAEEEMDFGLVRIIHASPDAPAVDVYANDDLILKGLEYTDASEYFLVPAGTHVIEMYPSGDKSTVVIEEIITVENEKHYSLAAIGELEAIHLATMIDDDEVSEGKTKIRMAHFSPDTPSLELATPIGNELFQEVIFSQVTEYMELDAEIHNFEIHLAGTDDAIVELHDLDMKEGAVYTALVIGLLNGEPEFEVLLLMDYMPTPDDIPKTGLGGASPLQ